jgi:uncharacterized membrane protein YraQ (UPF0718 family)
MFIWLDKWIGWLVENVFSLPLKSSAGNALHFFLYDTIKILILLSLMIFIISYVRTFFPPEKTKRILEKFRGIGGNILASLLGTVTPFCSCSSVPLFIGFVEAGVPLGTTFSFLITSPMINEAAFIVLLAAFGWKVGLIYVAFGITIGVLGGLIIGKMGMEKYVEQYVYEIKMQETALPTLGWKERMIIARAQVIDIVKRIWIFLIIGIGVGAFIHGWVPVDVLGKYAGSDNPLGVLVAVLIGIPLYSSASGTIPVAQALISKGVGLGTALSFMMSVTALSLPEMLLLKKVIKTKLIAVFVGIVGLGILGAGFLLNFGF